MRPWLKHGTAIMHAFGIMVWTFVAALGVGMAQVGVVWGLIIVFLPVVGFVLVLRRQFHYGWGATIVLTALSLSLVIADAVIIIAVNMGAVVHEYPTLTQYLNR